MDLRGPMWASVGRRVPAWGIVGPCGATWGHARVAPHGPTWPYVTAQCPTMPHAGPRALAWAFVRQRGHVGLAWRVGQRGPACGHVACGPAFKENANGAQASGLQAWFVWPDP